MGKLLANSGKPENPSDEYGQYTMWMKASEVWIDGIKPNVGDTATAKSIGRVGRAIHIWEACPKCGHERWIKRNARGTICQNCVQLPVHYGKDNCRYNPTRKTITKSGIRVSLDSSSPYYAMAHKCANGYVVLEHRLIMAQHIGRCLKQWEVVHHIDGNNLNNDINNLALIPNQAMHSAYTFLQVRIRELEARVTLLEAENVLIKNKLSSLGYGNPELNRELNP